MPPTSARRRRTRRPRRWPCSATSWRGTSTWRARARRLKASLDRRDDLDVRNTYEKMRDQHGFRILDYKVDNESAYPRVCFNFSEQLARKTDFSPYVAVSGASTRRSRTRTSRSASRA